MSEPEETTNNLGANWTQVLGGGTNADDTNAIENKRNEKSILNSYTSLGYKILYFLMYLILVIIIIIVCFSYSGLLLFVCKLAQSNILPTEINCAPYTDSQPNIESKPTHMFVQDNMSMKVQFPMDAFNSSNLLLDNIRKYKKSPSSNFLANYFIAIVEQLICFDFAAINAVMNTMNYILPETAIILLGPFLFSAAQGIIGGISVLYFVYIFFANMSWLFKTNTNTSGRGEPVWQKVSIFSPISFFIALSLAVLIIIFGVYGYKYFAILPGFIFTYCVFSCFFYRAKMNGKNMSAFRVVMNILSNYKLPIVILSCLAMVILSFIMLGTVPAIFGIFVLIMIFMRIIPINLFTTVPLSGLTPMSESDSNYTQAKKTCNV